METFIFSPEEAVGDYYKKGDFKEFEARVKEPLVVVGEAYRGNLIMFISKSGKDTEKMDIHYSSSEITSSKH
ncbi:hypothetical protein [Paenibacillus polymyxa]|uniref:hypothetical protein n=1 Tax=Paenibacillus polymyxa TaxID=1406 RepID=UPI0032AE980C